MVKPRPIILAAIVLVVLCGLLLGVFVQHSWTWATFGLDSSHLAQGFKRVVGVQSAVPDVDPETDGTELPQPTPEAGMATTDAQWQKEPGANEELFGDGHCGRLLRNMCVGDGAFHWIVDGAGINQNVPFRTCGFLKTDKIQFHKLSEDVFRNLSVNIIMQHAPLLISAPFQLSRSLWHVVLDDAYGIYHTYRALNFSQPMHWVLAGPGRPEVPNDYTIDASYNISINGFALSWSASHVGNIRTVRHVLRQPMAPRTWLCFKEAQLGFNHPKGQQLASAFVTRDVFQAYVADLKAGWAAQLDTVEAPLPDPHAQARAAGKIGVVVMNRGHTRRLLNYEAIVQRLRNRTDVVIEPARMEHLSPGDQTRLIRRNHILIGVHGGGLFWQAALQPPAGLIEISCCFIKWNYKEEAGWLDNHYTSLSGTQCAKPPGEHEQKSQCCVMDVDQLSRALDGTVGHVKARMESGQV